MHTPHDLSPAKLRRQCKAITARGDRRHEETETARCNNDSARRQAVRGNNDNARRRRRGEVQTLYGGRRVRGGLQIAIEKRPNMCYNT